MKQKINLLFTAFCLFTAVYAQEPMESVTLDQVEISADRTKMGRVVSVISRPEIERAAVRSLDDLLDYVAGIDVRQRGMYGVQADVSIRGGSFDQILVLLNGVNITDPQTGHYNLDVPVDVSDISRVEILQGSAARLLGPNAFSGAINIVTGENEKSSVATQLSAGSYGYLSNVVSGNYTDERFNLFGSVSHKRSDGYIKNTDFNIANAFLQGGMKTTNAGNFGLQFGYLQKSFGANSFYTLQYPNQFEHTKTFFSALTWNLKSDAWEMDAQAYWRQHHDRFELFRNFEGAENFTWYKGHNYHLTDVTGGKWVGSYTGNWGKTSLGIDLRNEHVFSNVLGEPMAETRPVPFESGQKFTNELNRLVSSAFLDHSVAINQWHLSAGATVSNTQKYGTHANGGADIAFKPTPHLRIFATANTAVRLPTFTELYYNNSTHKSNPDLLPEKSLTVELGAKFTPLNQTIAATTYYRKGYNNIDWKKPLNAPANTKWESHNLTAVNAMGVDVTYEYQFWDIFLQSAGISYSFLHLDKKAEGYDSKYALDYLKHKLILNLNHDIWSNLSAHWNFGLYDRSGDYTDFVTNKLTAYKPYLMFNTKLMWKTDRITLFAEVNNWLNQQYVDYSGIAQPGANFNTGIRLSL